MSMADSQPASLLAGRPAMVVGGGRMGVAIAQILASSGVRSVVVEPNAGIRAAGPDRLRAIFQARGQAEEGADLVEFVAEIEESRLEFGIVIEAAPESPELKRKIFQKLDQLLPADTILATNTSVIPIARITPGVVHKDRVVGAHFWNPPYAVRLVEVVQAADTSDSTVAQTMAFLAALGQEPVHVRKDIPGFIGNRLQHALKREAIALVQAGVADAETVDFVVRRSFGARLGIMGPLEQSDLVGLNLTLAIHEVVLPDLDVSNAPQRLLVDLVAQGYTGAGVGRGFRSWTPEQKAELQQRLDRELLRR